MKEGFKMKEDTMVKAGRLIMFDSGEYSDYGVWGFFVALKKFSPMKQLNDYFEENPNQKSDFEKGKFLHFLISQGLIMGILYDNFFLGSSDYEDIYYREFGKEEENFIKVERVKNEQKTI